MLRAADIAGANQLRLSAPLQEVLRAWLGMPGLLLIDGVDALRGAADRDTLSSIVAALAGTRWQVVATARTFDARNSQPLRRAFAGTPLSPHDHMRDSRLVSVRHLVVGQLSDTEVDEAIAPLESLVAVRRDAPNDLRALLRNPFNLRLAVELAEGLASDQHAQLLTVKSRTDLLAHYWEWRIHNEDRTAREALLARLCTAMVAQRTLQIVEAEPHVLGSDGVALEALLSQDVLSVQDGAIPGVGRLLTFSHNILFDYATALYVLYDPSGTRALTDKLDDDPALPLVARPSLEILIDLLWEHRATGAFWPTCLNVAGSEHVLASLTVVSRLLTLVHAADDLAELAPSRSETMIAKTRRQRVAGQLIGALRSRAVLPDPTTAIVPIATLARQLAENATTSYSDAALAVDLLTSLQLRSPAHPGDLGFEDRAQSVASVIGACLNDPLRTENLVGGAARHLPHLVASPATRTAITRLLDDDTALQQWGGTVLSWIAESVIPAMTSDLPLARRMASTVLNFKETRTDQVPLGTGSILRLNETRRQQAEHGTHHLSRAFGQLCATNLVVAAEIFCDLADSKSASKHSTAWPLTVPGATGWLSSGYDRGFSLAGHGDDNQMAAALAESLATGSGQIEAAVAVLVARLHSSAAWASILGAPTDREGLGRNLLPAMASGTLLAHPATHTQAAHLLAATAQAGTTRPAALEAAIAAALETAHRNDIDDRVQDVLIGCLPQNSISDQDLAARRAVLGDNPPEIPEPFTATSWTRAWSEVDALFDEGITVKQPVEAAARSLREEVNRVRNNNEATPPSDHRLIDAFLDADRVFAGAAPLPEHLQVLQVEAAATLAAHTDTAPGSPLGDQILAVLIAGFDSSNVGSLHE